MRRATSCKLRPQTVALQFPSLCVIDIGGGRCPAVPRFRACDLYPV